MMIMITIMREGFKSGRSGETSLFSNSLLRFKIIHALKYQTVLKIKVKVKQSHYRPGQAQRVPGS